MGASASREKFRESVTALIEEDVSPDDAEFWDELWKIPSSAEDVFELISPEAARRLRDERFDNLSTLFTQATAQLCQIVETPYNIYFDQALNCVRVLTRILPFLLEKGDLGDSDENVEHLCWGTGKKNNTSPTSEILSDDESATKSYEGESAVGSTIASSTLSRESTYEEDEDEEEDEQEPLALLVVHAAMHMLFLPQFTCDFYEDNDGSGELDNENGLSSSEIAKKRRQEEKEEREDREMRAEAGLSVTKLVENGVLIAPKPIGIIWAPGCGVTPLQLGSDGSTRKYDKNRCEVLRLLLTACCDPLFSPADEYNPLASRWLAVASAADAPNAVCLLYSLLNTVLSYDPVGIGVPYTNAFSSESYVKLVELSTQVLCVLLDCGLPGTPVPVLNEDAEPVIEYHEASKSGFNIFRVLIARIDSGRELTFCYNGFVRLMKNVYQSKISLLPNSVSKLECFQELLVLLWKMLEENPMFMNHVLTQCDVNEIIVPICFLMYQSRRDPAQIGLVHICTFILLKLSGERSLGVNLNKHFNTKLPCDMPLFTGSHLDLVCITLHKLIVNGAYKLVPLYSCFLTILCNISPYWRSMSLVAAVKLVNLFELFSSPKFLYSGEGAHRHLALLLEVFNNVIQYQYNGNQHLIYAIVRRKDSFGRLATLNLAKAVSQCNKVYGEHQTVEYDADAAEAKMGSSSFDEQQSDNSMSKENDGNEDIKSTSSTGTGTTDGEEDEKENTTIGNRSSATGEHFTPTEEWISELKASLPLETLTRLLQHVVPVIDELCNRQNGVVDEIDILEVLKDITMVGLLPVPHAIVVRKYQPNQYTALWFTAFMWGVIFLRNQSLPVFDGKAIELFQVSVQDP